MIYDMTQVATFIVLSMSICMLQLHILLRSCNDFLT